MISLSGSDFQLVELVFCIGLALLRMSRHAGCLLSFSVVTPLSSSYHLFSLCRLRALSGGGGGGSGGGGSSNAVASPPLSPALPKYKLADYRYGREEMLALYVKDNKVGRPCKASSGLAVI